MRAARPRGSALLLVTLFGTLILLTGIGLVSITSHLSKESYALNRQIVCRYAAEAVLQNVIHRVSREAELDQEGWFAQARLAADPVLTERITASAGSSDTPTVQISILDRDEAQSRWGQTIGAHDYIVEANATLDGFSSLLHMRMTYTSTSAGGGSEDPGTMFSKYLLWTRTGIYPEDYYQGNDWTLNGRHEGYIHIEGDVRLPKWSIFAYPLTCTGRFIYSSPGTLLDEQIRTFDYNLNDAIDSTPRPEYRNLSEAEVVSQSGGGRPSVPQPDYGDVEARFRAAAVSQTTNNAALRDLWIDAANPAYQSSGPMYVGSISHSTIRLVHDGSAGRTTAQITVYGSAGSRSASVPIPPGDPTIILTSGRITQLSGNYYANLTIASTCAGGPAAEPLPGLRVLGNPAITLTGPVISVDAQGRPKFWVYANDSMHPAPSSLGLTGVPLNDVSGSNVETSQVTWTAYWDTAGAQWNVNGWLFKRNAAYAAALPSVLGVSATRGDILFSTPDKGTLFMGALYAGHPDSRVYGDPSIVGGHFAHAGSTVSPQRNTMVYEVASPKGTQWFGYTRQSHFNVYDFDLLDRPPPYWMSPATSQTGSQFEITATFGSVYQAAR
jgi:hypothetical protein